MSNVWKTHAKHVGKKILSIVLMSHVHSAPAQSSHRWMSSPIYVCDWARTEWKWLLLMIDRNHSYVLLDSLICVIWFMHTCGMTHSYAWHDSFICTARLIHMCDMTHAYVWHDSFMCVTGQVQSGCSSCEWLTGLIHTCDMTCLCVWHDSFLYVWQESFMCAI